MNVAAWSDENLDRFGDYDAVVVNDQVWGNRAVHDSSCRLATALVDLGLQPGDRVMLLLPNGVALTAAFAAAVRAGGVAVPVFAGSSVIEIERIVGLSTPRAIVTTSELSELMLTADAVLKTIAIRIVVDGSTTGSTAWGPAGSTAATEPGGLGVGLDSLIQRYEPLASPVPRQGGDPAVICYTSGTSGAPKGVVHTHGSVHARHGGATRRLPARVLVALPLGTLGAGMLTGRLAHQWTLVLQDKFEPRAFLAGIARHRITKLVMVPAMGEAILAVPDLSSYDLTSLRSVGFTGADVPPALLTQLARVLPVNPSVAYGMTETGGGIAGSGLGSKPGSVGRILKGVDVRIVDEHGHECPPGEAGEVHVRTPWMGTGYHAQPEETGAAFVDGWIHTGDLGFVDRDRELFIVGRRKDLIIQGGVKVAPRDVSDVIRLLPDVAECAIVGVPHALLGEQVVACVVPRGGAAITEQHVLAHCRAKMDPRKVPARVWLRETLPRTPNEKINLDALRQQVTAAQTAVIDTRLLRQLRAAAPGERAQMLTRAIREHLLDIVPANHSAGAGGTAFAQSMIDSSMIDSPATFGDMGLDSLRIAQFAHALGDALGRAIAPTCFFSHPTVDALCRHLLGEIVGGASNTSNASAAHAAPASTRRVSAGEPIAIIGAGCRLPGGADTPEQFWSLLRQGVDATADISRWNLDAGLYDPMRGMPGKTYTRRAALLDAPDSFDAAFFGISARETRDLDPQHRLVFEVSWEALERAGYDPTGLADERAGLFLGIAAAAGAGGGLGSLPSMAVGRLCHFLDLRGPAMAVDTSCSSSLAAVHYAMQSLRLGECDVALAGGARVISSPQSFVGLSEMSLMAADGRCKAFAADADGFGRGEGCVMFVLKRLSDALAARDRIHVVIRGSALRHDGRSASLTAPNGRAQQEVIRAALEDGGVPATDVDYLEAHGTGTALGDPIEMEAAMAVLGDASRRLVVGSVKTNIGHLETAAGAAGLLKVALALEHAEIPVHLHCHELNPLLEPLASKFVIPQSTQPWPRTGDRLRTAAVTSMGLSGTNVHVVLEQAPAAVAPDMSSWEPVPQLLCLSSRTGEALRRQAARFADHFEQFERMTAANSRDGCFADHCFTANSGRAHFARRAAFVVRNVADARRQLLAHADAAPPNTDTGTDTNTTDTPSPRRRRDRETPPFEALPDNRASGAATVPGHRATATGEGAALAKPKLAFVFAGNGTKWRGASRQLYDTHEAYRGAIHRCAEILQPLLRQPLVDALYGDRPDAPSGELTAHSHDERELPLPVVFALEWSLCELWRSWGVEPDIVIGHDVGELVAACAAGAITLEDGLKLAAARGRPAEIENVVARIGYAPLQIPLVSTRTGARVESANFSTPVYWLRHLTLTEPLPLAQSLTALATEACEVFVVIAPDAALVDLARPIVAAAGRNSVWLTSLRAGRDDREQMLDSLAQLYVRGLDPNWRGFYGSGAYSRAILPTYPFERTGRRFRDPAAATRDLERRRSRPSEASRSEAAADQSLDELIAFVRHQVANAVGRSDDEVTVDENCLDWGLDSLGVLDVVTAVRERAGIACTPGDFLSRPSIAGFAAFVCERIAGAAATAATGAAAAAADASRATRAEPGRPTRVVVMNNRGVRAPLFCMHPAGGQVAAYLRLRALLGDDQPLYAIQSRALDDPAIEHTTIESMAAEYAGLMLAQRPKGPYRLLGWSMGGLVAIAVAAELERRGGRVDMVALVDAAVPSAQPRPGSAPERAFALAAIASEVQPAPNAASTLAAGTLTVGTLTAGKLRGGSLAAGTLTAESLAADARAVHTLPRGDLLAWCEAHGRMPRGALTPEAFDARLRLYEHHFALVRAYRPAVIEAPIVEWRASSSRQPYPWLQHSRSGAADRFVGGSHFSIMRPPHVERIAADLACGHAAHVRTGVAMS